MHATIVKTKDAEPLGTYSPTAIDERKAAADARILDCDGGKFTLRMNPGRSLQLSGRGIKQLSEGTYIVTRNALARIERTHDVVPDF